MIRTPVTTSERVVAMRNPCALMLIAALLSGCAHAPAEHVCNYKELVNATKPPHRMSVLVNVESGITFAGSERTVKVTARSADKGGFCSIPPDQLTVTWTAMYESEMPLSPTGNVAVFRPTHPDIYRVRVTVAYPPLEPRSELVNLPVITHEQNAVWHLKNTLETAFAREKAPPPLVEDLERYKAPLRAAYGNLAVGKMMEAIQQLELFREQLVAFHRDQSSWRAVVVETDNMIEGLREGDHRFDDWPVATGGAL